LNSFSNEVVAQLDLWAGKDKRGVYILVKSESGVALLAAREGAC